MDTIFDVLSRPAAALAVDVAVKATLVLAAAGVAALALRRAPAATRHLAWCLGSCGALALPVLALCMPGWALPVLPNGPVAAPESRQAVATVPAESGARDVTPEPPARAVIAATPSVGPPSRETAGRGITAGPPPMTTARAGAPSPLTWLASAWSAVMMLFLAVPMVGRFALWRLSRGAQPIEEGEWIVLLRDLAARIGVSRRVTLLRSRQALMPMTWGWLRPVVLLPDDADSWPVDRRRDVLLHELAHVKRLDCPTQAAAQLACALYWFNPLAWLAAHCLRIEREHACDDMVLLAGSRASDYADHLLDLARSLRSRHRRSFAALAMVRPSHLEGRLISILDPGCPRRGLTRMSVVLGLIALAVLVLPLSAVRPGIRAAETVATARRAEAPSEPRRIVSGRVVDPQNKPISGAWVAVIAERRRQVSDGENFERQRLAASATVDAEGRFRVDFATIPAARLAGLSIIAVAPGFGFDGNSLKTDAARQETTITLDPETVVEGRLVDVQGQPAAGVSVRVQALNVRFRGYSPYGTREQASLWPGPVATDRDGRFRLGGLGARAAITLEVEDLRYARQTLTIAAGDEGRSKPKTMSLVPAQAIEVRVVRDDDGKPMAGAWVNVRAERRNPYSWGESVGAKADDRGRVRIAPWPGDAFTIIAYPREGEPYLRREVDLDWPKGSVQQSVEVKLRRGVVARGKLTEEPSGEGVAGAIVSYYQTHRNNPLYLASFNRDTRSGPDGTFTLVVPYGPGHLLVQGPSDDYINVPTSHGELGTGWGPDLPLYPDAVAHLDLKPGLATHEIAVQLRRGVTVRGRVIGPDGAPIAEAFAMSRAYTPYNENRFAFMPFNGGGPQLKVRDGRFEVPGCDPDKPSPFHFLDVKDQLGATVEISGKSAATGPITVQLQKCGSARVLLKGADGKPLANHPADEFPGNMILVITPGADFGATDRTNADMEFQINLDPGRNRNLRTGPDGRVTFVSLIPGATYRYRGHEFTAVAGKTVDLPDFTVGGPK